MAISLCACAALSLARSRDSTLDWFVAPPCTTSRSRNSKRTSSRSASRLSRAPGVGVGVPSPRPLLRRDDERARRASARRSPPNCPSRRWTPSREQTSDDGAHPQAADPPRRRQAHRDGADALRPAGRRRGRATVCVSSQAGCAMGCVLLRDRPGRLRAQPHDGRDPRAGDRIRARAGAIDGGAAPSRTSSSWAWASRWRTTAPSGAPSRR